MLPGAQNTDIKGRISHSLGAQHNSLQWNYHRDASVLKIPGEWPERCGEYGEVEITRELGVNSSDATAGWLPGPARSRHRDAGLVSGSPPHPGNRSSAFITQGSELEKVLQRIRAGLCVKGGKCEAHHLLNNLFMASIDDVCLISLLPGWQVMDHEAREPSG